MSDLNRFVDKQGHISAEFRDIFMAFLQSEVYDFIVYFLKHLKEKYNKEILDIPKKIDKLDKEKIDNILMLNLAKISTIDDILNYFVTWKKDLEIILEEKIKKEENNGKEKI